MNNKIIEKVNSHIREMYKFNDPSIKSIMLEVNDSNIPMSVKVELIQKLSLASDKINGKWVPPGQLMRGPDWNCNRRKTSYRAKYKGNFSGGGAGSSRSTRQ
tara:strand:- start:9 stop:314 length:306 start_codon:yes stop_codon:yes gene_type:complete